MLGLDDTVMTFRKERKSPLSGRTIERVLNFPAELCVASSRHSVSWGAAWKMGSDKIGEKCCKRKQKKCLWANFTKASFAHLKISYRGPYNGHRLLVCGSFQQYTMQVSNNFMEYFKLCPLKANTFET